MILNNILSKKYLIDSSLGMGYKIILNPYLTFYGETLIFYDNSKHVDEENEIQIEDYGRLPSLRKINYTEDVLSHIKDEISIIKPPNSALETNIFNFSDNFFFTEQDIFALMTAVKEIDGMAVLRILPKNYTDCKYFGSSKIKIIKLPMKDIQYETLPLQLKIENTITDLKRDKIKHLMESEKIADSDLKVDVLISNEEFTHYFEINDFFKIESYSENNIKHLVKSYTNFNFTSTNLATDIKAMFGLLNINDETGHGFNLCLTKNFVFLAPLTKPYCYDKNKVPYFAEPHFFAGLFTLPYIEADWPETINGEFLKFDFIEILKKSTN
jgi:hypothetical protein